MLPALTRGLLERGHSQATVRKVLGENLLRVLGDAELTRLLRLHRAYEHANAGDEAVTRGDAPAALKEYAAARELALTDSATKARALEAALSDAAFFAIPNREVCFMDQLDLSG